jgi:hypothetical protein
LVLGVIGADPQRWGYQATVWTRASAHFGQSG